jgi:cyclase
MFRPRIIPTLLLKGKGLVKTIRFKKTTYIGDPINAVKIFNDLEADELCFLDITATIENRLPDTTLIRLIADEAYMPFAIGGGIKTLNDARTMFNAGAEKVILNSETVMNPSIITDIAMHYGSQSVVVSIDYKKNFWGKHYVHISSGKYKTHVTPIEHAIKMQEAGAGEILLTNIDLDGTMIGYDTDTLASISQSLNIPVIASGGAGNLQHIKDIYYKTKVSAMAAGSMFVFYGPRRAVLINYPTKNEIKIMFSDKL